MRMFGLPPRSLRKIFAEVSHHACILPLQLRVLHETDVLEVARLLDVADCVLDAPPAQIALDSLPCGSKRPLARWLIVTCAASDSESHVRFQLTRLRRLSLTMKSSPCFAKCLNSSMLSPPRS